MHGSFSRADTWNFMAMQGPDFKSQFVDPAPASNADLGRTIAQLMQLDTADKGKLIGRVSDRNAAQRGGAGDEEPGRHIGTGREWPGHGARHAERGIDPVF